MSPQIEYKATYNEGRDLPEPKWGSPMTEISPDYLLQCPTCCSHKMYASAHPDDPEEIFPNETVRCGDCGRITDWYEAHSQYEHHHTEEPMPVIRTPRVLNKKTDNIPPDAVYVGRPSKWGNPFIIGKDGNRDEVIIAYMSWFTLNKTLRNDLHELKGKDLVCWCAPLPCHADVLLELANKEETIR